MPMLKLFFYSPKHLENLAAIVRTLEVFGIREVYVYDSYNVVLENYGKAYKRKLNKISSGSYKYIKFHRIVEPLDFIKKYPHRVIASVLKNHTAILSDFKFENNDLLLMGNETVGLPEEVIAKAQVKLKIPQAGETESLNLGIATGIFIYEWAKQKIS